MTTQDYSKKDREEKWHSRGRQFNSVQLHQIFKGFTESAVSPFFFEAQSVLLLYYFFKIWGRETA